MDLIVHASARVDQWKTKSAQSEGAISVGGTKLRPPAPLPEERTDGAGLIRLWGDGHSNG